MKKLLLCIAILSMPLILKAELRVSAGNLDLILPFSSTESVYLYDFIGKRGLLGLETPVIRYRGLEASVGVVTDADLDGAPFVGVRKLVQSPLFPDSFFVGLWAGRDFRNNEYQAGIKASIKLWE